MFLIRGVRRGKRKILRVPISSAPHQANLTRYFSGYLQRENTSVALRPYASNNRRCNSYKYLNKNSPCRRRKAVEIAYRRNAICFAISNTVAVPLPSSLIPGPAGTESRWPAICPQGKLSGESSKQQTDCPEINEDQ
jgi:hypothetical protein